MYKSQFASRMYLWNFCMLIQYFINLVQEYWILETFIVPDKIAFTIKKLQLIVFALKVVVVSGLKKIVLRPKISNL